MEPEYLESSGGRRLGAAAPDGGAGGRRTAWLAGGLVAALAVLGAGAWAAWSFFSTGPQPAEALPDTTLAYASVDLDPSGAQKIEAVRTLRKFPAFEERVGLDTDDDVRQRIFEAIQGEGTCEELDYGDDVEPWLGDRMAVAAVGTGEAGAEPDAVFVLQVGDEDAADAGLEKIRACSGGDGGAWVIDGGWALVGESQDVVDEVAGDAEDAPLAEDDDYSRWTDEAGDAGIASVYVAPEAGRLIADELTGLTDQVGSTDAGRALEEFEGLAATVRFDDGALELEVAADAGDAQQALGDSARGDDALSTLPADTAAALGVGFADGWFGDVVDQLATSMGEGSADDLLAEMSEASGLDLPDDVETLTGDSAALAVGSDFDPEAFLDSPDGSGIPIGYKVQGDAEEIEAVLDKLRTSIDPEGELVASDTEGDTVVVSPDDDYREQLLEDGDLGGSEVFENVVREAGDASAVFFVNFDVGDDWLASAAEDDPEVGENLAPLEGLGLSAWVDGDTSHAVLRVTTD